MWGRDNLCVKKEGKRTKKEQKLVRKLVAAIDFVTETKRENGEMYREKLEKIVNKPEIGEKDTEKVTEQSVDLGFVLDYYRLLTDREYMKKREDAWERWLPTVPLPTSVPADCIEISPN